ncbi:MAG: radical SAM family heme chaperone HemW [Deltaproteobacteria bacterium]|nr:radical SAM family heme chaperone HemW [Deltaproteobacteria bacterium]
MELTAKNNAAALMGIYVHVPYCVKKCLYCDFNSKAVKTFDSEIYARAIKLEMETKTAACSPETRLNTLYIGGGTPSVLSPKAIETIINTARTTLSPVSGNIEITLEANPDTIDREKLASYKEAGVNRISLGIQSLNDFELKTLGRPHDVTAALMAFDAARAAGFDNISIDLMFALPGQDMKTWEETLKKAMGLAPEHVSIYGLTIEDNTPFGMSRKDIEVTMPMEDEQILMYKGAVQMLTDFGLRHYEISNLAKPGMESRHNSGYWNSTPYIGLGPGAHSYYAPTNGQEGFGKRLWNEQDTDKYLRSALDGRSTVAGEEALSKEQAITEAVLTGLRVINGIDSAAFERRFGVELSEYLDLKTLTEAGLIRTKGQAVALSIEGILLSNEIFASIGPVTS